MQFTISVFLTFLLMGRAGTEIGPTPCGVTTPNGNGATGGSSPDVYGNGQISVWLGAKDGTVVFKPGGPGVVLADGALSMKFGWDRRVRGRLTIDGHRLDAEAPPLRANIPAGYGDIGFQSTSLIFPTPGCWEVTGHVSDANITFVTRVVKLGAGPSAH